MMAWHATSGARDAPLTAGSSTALLKLIGLVVAAIQLDLLS
jgi:hypothetical protein